MAKIGIEVDDKQLEAAILELNMQTGNVRPVMATIGRKVGTRIRLGFKSGTSPDGKRWAPLKTRIGQPLQDTGRLRSSITQNVGPDYVDVGTNVKYAFIHQFGKVIKAQPGSPGQNSIGKRKGAKHLVFPIKAGGGVLAFAKEVTIPARPFMPIGGSGQLDLPGPWQDDVLTALRRHLLRQKQQG